MPAAAVIPAPRVYIKAVAIKTLVVYIVVVCLCVAILFHGSLFLRGSERDTHWCMTGGSVWRLCLDGR